MKRFRELSIVTPNKPGKLTEVLRALARESINVLALDSSCGYDMNLVRIVTSDPSRTQSALEKLGYNVTVTTVLAVSVVDRPGQLAALTSKLAKAKVNIDYMHATAPGREDSALVMFHVSDPEAAERALRARV
jgi:hypothetical protein